MEIFVLLLAIFVCISAEEYTPKTGAEMKAIRSECLEAHPLTEEQLSKIDNLDFPNEEAVRQYLMCFVLKSNLYCPHEGYHADRLVQQFRVEGDDFKKMTEDCIRNHPKGDQANDVHIYETHSCFMESDIGKKYKASVQKHHEEHAHHA